MSSIKLKLRKNPSGTCKIRLHFNYGRKQVYRYSTKYTIQSEKLWDKSKQRIKVRKDDSIGEDINLKLDKLERGAENLLREYEKTNKKLNSSIIKRDLKNIDENENLSNKKNQGLLDYFEWFIDYYSKNPRPRTNKAYKKGTLKTIRNSKEKLEHFQVNYGHLEFESVTLDFHKNLLNFLNEQKLSDNYKGTIIKNLKTVMNDAYERDYHNNLDFKKSGFIKPKSEAYNIYLSQQDIDKITALDLKGIIDNPEEYYPKGTSLASLDLLNRVRDFFLIGCHTGLRIQDILSLTQKNIETITSQKKTFKIISLIPEKVEKPVEIPIKKQLEIILNKYDECFPRKVSDVKINKYIKVICKAAGLTEIDNHKKVPRYSLVSSHTARRSFCTNAYKEGMHVLDIMSISGHSSPEVFLNYIKATPRDRLNQIKNHPFFW